SGDKGKDFADMLVLIGQEFGLGDSTKISLTSSELTQLQHVFNQNMYIGAGEKPDASGSSYEHITSFLIKLMSNKAGLGWTSYSHTGINVPVYAIGPGSEMFKGMIDNTDIPKNLEKLLMIQE
ncbi:MAG: alkaline phosphatase, partial [Bacteroidetes bacterium]|nr:alkaline phosphatase [Bacteroidota bacterium]